MRRRLFFFVFCLLCLSALPNQRSLWPGALSDIMQAGDLSVKIVLDTVQLSNLHKR